MPTKFDYDYNLRRCELRKLAERQVAEKFPNLLHGSSGWYRAVENRRRRLGG
jgi:hypothetical protein